VRPGLRQLRKLRQPIRAQRGGAPFPSTARSVQCRNERTRCAPAFASTRAKAREVFACAASVAVPPGWNARCACASVRARPTLLRRLSPGPVALPPPGGSVLSHGLLLESSWQMSPASRAMCLLSCPSQLYGNFPGVTDSSARLAHRHRRLPGFELVTASGDAWRPVSQLLSCLWTPSSCYAAINHIKQCLYLKIILCAKDQRALAGSSSTRSMQMLGIAAR
jgi:hypothetical protein